jgi:hypothetical protein
MQAVSFSSPNEICRSPSGVFKVKLTLSAIGNAAGMVAVEGVDAGPGVWTTGALGVVDVLAGAGVAVEPAVLLESSVELGIVDVPILHLLIKPEIKR